MTTNTIRLCKKCQAETEHYANGGRCKPCSNAYSKTYSKAWQALNPEKVKANNDAWRAANPEKAKAYSKAWRDANPDKHRALVKAAQTAKAAKFALYEAFYLANQGQTPSK